MIVYEVTLCVDAEVAGDYASWLSDHVEAMLELPGFVSAQRERLLDPAQPGKVVWVVRYLLPDRDALDAYFATQAGRMRADGLARFPGRFSASRRILAVEAKPDGQVAAPS